MNRYPCYVTDSVKEQKKITMNKTRVMSIAQKMLACFSFYQFISYMED